MQCNSIQLLFITFCIILHLQHVIRMEFYESKCLPNVKCVKSCLRLYKKQQHKYHDKTE